jgi:hypothetical protein
VEVEVCSLFSGDWRLGTIDCGFAGGKLRVCWVGRILLEYT